MTKKLIIVLCALILALGFTLDAKSFAEEKDNTPVKQEVLTSEEITTYQNNCNEVDPINLVSTPRNYLDKYVTFKGVFNKYTTLGLDYKPALRDSKDYITFLIERPNVKAKNYVIPLSELKLIIPRKIAEQYTNLETKDNIIIYGKVFSDALNDPWVDVHHIISNDKELTKPEKDNK